MALKQHIPVEPAMLPPALPTNAKPDRPRRPSAIDILQARQAEILRQVRLLRAAVLLAKVHQLAPFAEVDALLAHAQDEATFGADEKWSAN